MASVAYWRFVQEQRRVEQLIGLTPMAPTGDLASFSSAKTWTNPVIHRFAFHRQPAF